ncbi:MAG: amidohydrolase [Planctomycetota bacterium]|nr:amidohydrolase [Planctomycetota bacterium]
MPTPLEQAQKIQPELVEIRRDLHRHPEIAFEEVRTGTRAAEFCEKLGLHVQRGAAKTGVVATLNGDKPGPAVALRADMDALPIQEENEVSYRSTIQGKGHLCGHDAHTTMLMGAARLIAENKERIPFPVHFFFQPAEEVPNGGASKLIAEGHLDGVGEVFGLHVNPQLPTGVLGLRAGPTMASMDRFELRVEGLGGHGAMPHLSHDPVTTAAEIVLALQTVVARRIDPLDPAVVSVCQIDAGSAFNVIPQACRLIGTARSLSGHVRERLPELIEEIAQGVARAHGLNAACDYLQGTPVLVNRKESADKMARAIRNIGGKDSEIRPTMGGEDFAWYLERVPGCFGFLGAGDGSAGTGQCFHHPRFNIDEGALAWGSALFLQLVLDRAQS